MSFSCSPYMPGEFVTAYENGAMMLCSEESQGVVLNDADHRFKCCDAWWSAHYGSHPRQLVLSDRTGVALYDVRVSLYEISGCVARAQRKLFQRAIVLSKSGWLEIEVSRRKQETDLSLCKSDWFL